MARRFGNNRRLFTGKDMMSRSDFVSKEHETRLGETVLWRSELDGAANPDPGIQRQYGIAFRKSWKAGDIFSCRFLPANESIMTPSLIRPCISEMTL
jgi:hypothetical protein